MLFRCINMIKICNFRNDETCTLTSFGYLQRAECSGESKCVLYQIYKNTYKRPETKAKKSIKPLQKTKDGKYRNPNRAMKVKLRELAKKE